METLKLVFTDSNDRWYNEKESYDNDETTSTCLRHSFSGPFEVEVEVEVSHGVAGIGRPLRRRLNVWILVAERNSTICFVCGSVTRF